MIRKVVVTGVTVAAIVGTGTGALALTGRNSTTGTPSANSPSANSPSPNSPSSTAPSPGTPSPGRQQRAHPLGRALLRHAAHAQVVTHGPHGFIRHDVVVGTCSAVSAQSITVKAADGYAETFSVAPATKVRKRANGTGSPSEIAAVRTGDKVAVGGDAPAGSHGSVQARFVVDGVSR